MSPFTFKGVGRRNRNQGVFFLVWPDGFSWGFRGFSVVFRGSSSFCFVVFRGFAFFAEEFTTVLHKFMAPLNSWVCMHPASHRPSSEDFTS